MAVPAQASRRLRERELVKATRALFDERGMQDAPIEEVARAVGIARGLVYRHFSSKDELFVLTITDYLAELGELLAAATAGDDDPAVQLERCIEAFAGYGERYPAFLDSSLALMRRPARELRENVSESVWLRLGQSMASCLDEVAQVLRAGSRDGSFDVGDADYMANFIWTQTLGAMRLARIEVGVRAAGPGVPDLFRVAADDVVRTCVESAMATVRCRAPSGERS